MRVVEPDGKLGTPLPGVPQVAGGGQGGLLDVVLDSGFERNRQLFFCFSEPGAGGNSTALARARLAPDRSRLEDVQVIFSQKPKVASNLHFGCRIVETPDGLLFLTLGERFSRMQDAQRLDNHLGKVLRLTKDGKPAAGNPFSGRQGALPEIWSYRPSQFAGRHAGAGWPLLDARARPAGRRRDQPAAGRPQLWLARHHPWRELRRRSDRGGHHAPRKAWSSPRTTGCPRSRPRAWPSSPATATARRGRATCSSARSSSATSTASRWAPTARSCASTSCWKAWGGCATCGRARTGCSTC
jgi:hypothetical protein